MEPSNPSQRYLSTRGGSYDLSFEEVVLKGLAQDGGLFIPEEIPVIPGNWLNAWKPLSFENLAFHIYSLFISPREVPSDDLNGIIRRSYSSFRAKSICPLVTLDQEKHLHILELFHGPTFAFKDVALQFLGNLFEYFLVRQNKGKTQNDRSRLTVIGATSGDTGSAAIYGLRRKKDVSVFILHPRGKISPVQEAQMTSVLDSNVHNVAIDGTFDDCQDIVKALFADPEMNEKHKLAAVNSINWARILAQISYYFFAYVQLCEAGKISFPEKIRFVVPTGNFGDVLAGYFAKRMGLPVEKLVVATNANDILHRFWHTGKYEKKAANGETAQGGFKEDGAKAHESGVKETLSPAMDILVSSNFERLLWYFAYRVNRDNVQEEEEVAAKRIAAGKRVKQWQSELKATGGFSVNEGIIEAAREDFQSERVDDEETVNMIRSAYRMYAGIPVTESEAGVAKSSSSNGTEKRKGGYILDPHSAIGIAASLRCIEQASQQQQQQQQQQKEGIQTPIEHVSLATAHPAKFSKAVQMALSGEAGFKFEDDVLPEEFRGLEDLPRRMERLERPLELGKVRDLMGRLLLSEAEEKEGGKSMAVEDGGGH